MNYIILIHSAFKGFLIAVESVQYLDRTKGREQRTVYIRDDTIEESRSLILRGEAVRTIIVTRQ